MATDISPATSITSHLSERSARDILAIAYSQRRADVVRRERFVDRAVLLLSLSDLFGRQFKFRWWQGSSGSHLAQISQYPSNAQRRREMLPQKIKI